MTRRSAVALVLACLTVPACADAFLPATYSATAVRATVVDAESGTPVAGAVVVAVWQLDAISGTGPRLKVSETATDAGGGFFVAGWGSKLRPPLTQFGQKSPYLAIFKTGYVPVRLFNAPKADFARLRALTHLTAVEISYRGGWQGDPEDATQESLWNGMILRIEPFRGTPEQWLGHIDNIKDAVVPEDAKYVPKFYGALSRERDYFRTHPVDSKNITKVFESVFGAIERRARAAKENP